MSPVWLPVYQPIMPYAMVAAPALMDAAKRSVSVKVRCGSRGKSDGVGSSSDPF